MKQAERETAHEEYRLMMAWLEGEVPKCPNHGIVIVRDRKGHIDINEYEVGHGERGNLADGETVEAALRQGALEFDQQQALMAAGQVRPEGTEMQAPEQGGQFVAAKEKE